MAMRHGLGRGLDALLRDGGEKEEQRQGDTAAPPTAPATVPVAMIRKSSWQPRRRMDETSLAELTESVRTHGVLQPLLVRRTGEAYELIAGERRLRAATAAGLIEVPVKVMEAAESVPLELALIENIQRENLNVIEEAEGYHTLMTRFNLTQDNIARRVGKSRAAVANALRILNLPAAAKQYVADGRLSPGHAKILAGLEIEAEQILYAEKVVAEDLSVRELESLLRKALRAPRKPRVARSDMPDSHIRHLSDMLHQHFGTAARITPCSTLANGRKRKGSIELDYYSNDDLDRILQIMGLAER